MWGEKVIQYEVTIALRIYVSFEKIYLYSQKMSTCQVYFIDLNK